MPQFSVQTVSLRTRAYQAVIGPLDFSPTDGLKALLMLAPARIWGELIDEGFAPERRERREILKRLSFDASHPHIPLELDNDPVAVSVERKDVGSLPIECGSLVPDE